MKSENALVVGNLDYTELMGVLSVHGNSGNGTSGVGVLMRRNHVSDIHPIDVIRAENRHDMGLGLFDEIDVLIDGVRGSLVPGFSGRAHFFSASGSFHLRRRRGLENSDFGRASLEPGHRRARSALF